MWLGWMDGERESHVLWGECECLKTLDDCLDEAAKTAAHINMVQSSIVLQLKTHYTYNPHVRQISVMMLVC
jgi:hypothetical protein